MFDNYNSVLQSMILQTEPKKYFPPAKIRTADTANGCKLGEPPQKAAHITSRPHKDPLKVKKPCFDLLRLLLQRHMRGPIDFTG